MRIRRLSTLHAPVFLVNSRLALVSAAPARSGQQVSITLGAPLLPKLRGHFAEFLQHRSLKRLGMLYQSTSVGFGYGLCAGAVSWKSVGRHPNPIRDDLPQAFVAPRQAGEY